MSYYRPLAANSHQPKQAEPHGVVAMLSLDRFSDIVDHIYDGAVDPAQWPHILGRLMHASGAAAGALLASDSQQRQLKAVHVGFDQAAQVSYNQYYCGIDPVAPVLERSPLGSVLLSH